MRLVPWWVLLSAGCAPVLLVSGWTIAALLQGPGYDPVTQTISILAAYGARGYWVMTAAVIALGTCHLVTAWGLRTAALAGRVALAAGGSSAILLALFPAPLSGGSFPHASVVTVGCTLLALWPLLAAGRGRAIPWGLRTMPAIMATALMFICAAWFVIALLVHNGVGIAERALTFAQSFWPLVVAASCLLYQRSYVRSS